MLLKNILPLLLGSFVQIIPATILFLILKKMKKLEFYFTNPSKAFFYIVLYLLLPIPLYLIGIDSLIISLLFNFIWLYLFITGHMLKRWNDRKLIAIILLSIGFIALICSFKLRDLSPNISENDVKEINIILLIIMAITIFVGSLMLYKKSELKKRD